MKKRLLIILAIILIGFTANAQAYDFTAVSNGQTLYFNVISATAPYTVEVTSQNTDYPYYTTFPVGDIIIPSTVTNSSITYSVVKIGDYAFTEAVGLTSITIPNTITSIGLYAFSSCNSLTTVTIPNSVTSMGEGAFSRSSGLTTMIIPNSITSIPNRCFLNCTSLSSITLPSNLTSIEGWAFNNCISLTSIDIPTTVTSLEELAFANCSGLTSIIIPEAITTIEASLFGGCTSLTSIIIPNAVTSIRSGAFNKCRSLTSITIPSNVTSIEMFAFRACYNLTSIFSDPIIPPTLHQNAFFETSKTIPVYVACASIAAYQAADYWNEFTNIQCTTGLNDILSLETQTKLYPNPTTGNAILGVEGLTTSADVFVYDITGRKVKTYNLQPNQTQLSIDLTSFAKGIYQVKVLNQTKKLIVN